MGAKGNRRHVKRYNTPGFIQIERKKYTFFLRSEAGSHPKNLSLPLGHAIRDLLKLSNNLRETKLILNSNKVLVDGRVRTNPRFTLGLMDVLEIPEISKSYRVLPSKKKGLVLSEITKEESKFKLCRIENMTTIKKGHLQLNLHDGRNIIVEVKDATKKPEFNYKTRGTLKISLPDQKILDFYPLEEKSQAIIVRGKNIGFAGKISSLTERFGVNASTAAIEAGEGELINTAINYAFVIGKDKPSIDLPMEL